MTMSKRARKMEEKRIQKHQRRVRRLLERCDWSPITYMHLRLKREIISSNGDRRVPTLQICYENFAQFMRRLNKGVFLSFGPDQEQGLTYMVTYIFGGDDRGSCCAAAIQEPKHLSRDTFEHLIKYAWLSTRWGKSVDKDFHHDVYGAWTRPDAGQAA